MSPGPGVLWVFRWRGRPVFLRVTVGGGGRPPCPRLYDDVIAVPVVPSGGRRPVGCRVRRFVAVADWLQDIVPAGDGGDDETTALADGLGPAGAGAGGLL